MRLSLPRAAAAAGLLAAVVLTAAPSAAQDPPAKKALTHADYDSWRTAAGVTLSPNGKFVAYNLLPAEGEGEVVVRHVATGKEFRVPRGANLPATAQGQARPAPAGGPTFSPDVKRLVFPLIPTRAETEKAKADKVRPGDMPQPVLAVMDLDTGKIVARIPQVKSFEVGGSGAGFVVYQRHPKVEPKSETPPAKAEPPKAAGPAAKGGTAPEPRPAPTMGTDLVIRNLATGGERTLFDVTEHTLSRDGKLLVYAVGGKNPDVNGVFALDPASFDPAVALRAGPGRYSRLTWDRKQTRLVFLFDGAGFDPHLAPPPRPVRGTGPVPPPQPKYRVFLWDRNTKATTNPVGALPGPFGGLAAATAVGVKANAAGMSPAAEVFGPDTPGQRKGWAMTDRGTFGFSQDGTRLVVPTAPVRPSEPAPQASGDKIDLDIWHWKDTYIQPMQRVRGDFARNRTFTGVFSLDTREFRQLSDETLNVGLPPAGDWALGSDDAAYRHLIGYTYPIPEDYALVNVRTGERKRVLTKFSGSVSLSPDGKHLLTFDGKDWVTIAVADGKRTNLTGGLKVKFFDEDDDHPAAPPAYSPASWSSDGKFVLAEDRYDVWKLAADWSSAENLTKTGRPAGIRFTVVNPRAAEDAAEGKVGTDLSKPLLLEAVNLHTRDTGFFRLEPGGTPKLLVMGARKYGTPVRAKNADVYLLTVQTFYDYPDYYVTGPDFHELKRVTDVNPKVREFNWGKAELVHYHSADGVPLSGVLIKPENFDPSKKYPMIVYIYERLSDTLHNFRLPLAGTSINPTFYASNGYLVFMPDIAYKVGYPGQGALKCVLPAISAVVEKGYVDEHAIGVQGHSWGGYQIAYMVTQTTRFKAAAAGAPVSNMVSAYGGIRWGSGLPRQFQYEQTQSRIGGTLWEHPMRFIENSPVFMPDRVQTPLLMLHNDQDDAVPWYQGIEYFLALRRLGKECYLLNYNGELHGLRKKATQRDYTMRMFQFFEHHLKGAPAPEWMAKGVPFTERDREKEQWRKLFAPEKK